MFTQAIARQLRHDAAVDHAMLKNTAFQLAVLTAILLLLVLYIIGLPPLATPVIPGGDLAADMAVANKFRDEGLLLTGHYSRFGFHHPGPFFFYANALTEKALGASGLPRYQLWVLSTAALNTIFIAMAAWFFSLMFFDRLRFVPALLFGSVAVAALQADLVCVWMPCRLETPYMAFVLSVVLLAKGHGRFLPVATLLAGILIHGYASLPLFTLPFLLAGCLIGHYRAKNAMARNPYSGRLLWASAAIAATFALPILGDALIHPPGNLSVMLAAQRHFWDLPKPSWPDLWHFFYEVLAPAFPAAGIPGLDRRQQAVLLAAAFLCLLPYTNERYRRDAAALASLLAAQAVAIGLYYKYGTPAPLLPFIGQFYLSAVPILMACALILPLFLGRHAAYKEVMPLIALLPMLFLQPATPPRHIAETILFSDTIARDTHRPGVAVIDYATPRMWSLMTGLLLELDRRGIPACTTWREWAPFYTDKDICAEAIPRYRIIRAQDCLGDCIAKGSDYGLIRTLS